VIRRIIPSDSSLVARGCSKAREVGKISGDRAAKVAFADG
jgi:hypothetical protein